MQFCFLYYGPELDAEACARLEQRWTRQPRNRGRSLVSCEVSPVGPVGDTLVG